jgi:hypothetical protein
MPTAPGLTPTAVPSVYEPEVHLDVPVDAFGGAVGHALQGLGGQIEQSSDKIWQRAVEMQGLQNETEAKNADAKYMMESGKMHAEFINKEGLNAGPQALQQHIQELQDKRVEIRNSLGNPAAQKMYDASSLGFMGRNIFNAAGHSGQQMKVAGNKASDSRIDLAKTSIGENPEDDINVRRMQRVIESETEAKGRTSGWTPEQIEATKQSEVSEAVMHRIAGISKTNAPKAQRMLDDAIEHGAIRPQDAERIQATVQTQFRDQGSRFISDKVLAGRRNGDEENKPVQDYIDTALDEAKKYSTKDPLFQDYVRNRVVTDYNRQKAVETDADNQNVRTIGQALLKGNKEGALPTSIEELKSIDPAVGPAWDAISRDPKKQQAVLKQLESNAKGDRVVTTPENLQQFHTFRGQALAGTDDERAEFLAHNFATEGKMTISQRNQLMTMQDQLKHRAALATTDDPRIARALRFLKPDMIAAGIDPRGGEQPRKDYYGFVGAMQDQLDQYQKDHPGKLPTMEEVRTMGAQLMQEQITSKGIISFFDTKEPFYKMTVPDDDLKRLREDPYWKKRNVVPNDDMLSRIYRAEQFKEKYGGSAKKPAEAAFPPNAPEGK